MLAKTLVETRGPNPAFDKEESRRCQRLAIKYHVPADIVYPAGTIFDHPDVWVHCVKAKPTHAPADAVCAERVKAWLNHPQRRAMLARIKHLAMPDVFKTCPQWLKDYVTALTKKWSAELDTVEADESATAADIAGAIEDLGGTVPNDDSDSDDDALDNNPYSDLPQ